MLNPWRNAFLAERLRPSRVFGPVLRCALARLASSLRLLGRGILGVVRRRFNHGWGRVAVQVQCTA